MCIGSRRSPSLLDLPPEREGGERVRPRGAVRASKSMLCSSRPRPRPRPRSESYPSRLLLFDGGGGDGSRCDRARSSRGSRRENNDAEAGRPPSRRLCRGGGDGLLRLPRAGAGAGAGAGTGPGAGERVSARSGATAGANIVISRDLSSTAAGATAGRTLRGSTTSCARIVRLAAGGGVVPLATLRGRERGGGVMLRALRRLGAPPSPLTARR